jgi:hypothetical protein
MGSGLVPGPMAASELGFGSTSLPNQMDAYIVIDKEGTPSKAFCVTSRKGINQAAAGALGILVSSSASRCSACQRS